MFSIPVTLCLKCFQGKKDEDGPFIILEGASGASCNTKQLDNPDRVDFDNGKVAEFTTEDTLQSCYKVIQHFLTILEFLEKYTKNVNLRSTY